MSKFACDKSNLRGCFVNFLLITFWFFAFYITHLYHIGSIPGFHYDEAWFANRATEMMLGARSVFDLQGMSPFTTIYQSAWASFFLDPFGQTVAVFRASEMVFVFIGFIFFHLAYRLILLNSTQGKSAEPKLLSPLWLFVSLPYFSINHRFAIELTTTHVFFAGLCIYSFYRYFLPFDASIQSGPFAIGTKFNTTANASASVPKTNLFFLGVHFISALLGFYNHLLFLALLVGIWGPVLFTRDFTKTERTAFAAFVICLFPRLFQIAMQIPEKDKAFSLVAFVFAFGFWATISGAIPSKIRFYFMAIVESVRRSLRNRSLIILFPFVVAIIFVPLFFLTGFWSIDLITGGLDAGVIERFLTNLPYAITVGLSLIVFLFSIASRKKNKYPAIVSLLSTQVLVTTLLTLILSIKPTPRYFELSNLMFILSISVLWAMVHEGPLKKLRVICAVSVLSSILCHIALYTRGRLSTERLTYGYRNESIQFMFFKDSSRDFSLTQPIANALSSNGCGLNNIEFTDPRTKEAMTFQLPDLGISCHVPRIRIERCQNKVLGFCINPELDSPELQNPK